MKVKFTNLYKLAPNKKKIFSKIKNIIVNSSFIGGSEVKNFEYNFKKYTGSKFCISVANGTDALEIAVNSLNLKKGSEIIVPVNTWISTAEAVVNNGYKLVFCDISLDDYTVDLEDLKKKINKNTSAIIVVHLYGNPAKMNKIKQIIKNKKIRLIEDCAQAHGSRIKNKHVGTFGDIGTFSFFPGKNLGAFGDAGGIITNSKKIANYCFRARGHGALFKYDHKFSGRNSRSDSLQCAILNIKLKKYKNVLKKRNKLAEIYFNGLKKVKNLYTFNRFKNNIYSYHQFVIRVNDRNKLKKFLHEKGIETLIHYPYMLNELKFFKYKKKLKNSFKLGEKILSLPISEEHKISEIKYIIKTIKNYYSKL